MKPALLNLVSAPKFGGVFEDLGTLIGGGASAVIDVAIGLLLAPLNIIAFVTFKVLLLFIGAFYDLMVGTVTATPHPTDSNGNMAIFSTPTGTWAGLQQVLENGIIPITLLFVIFGIAIVMFVRVFDVAISLGDFDGETAQKRLLLAPLLISLWVPLANLVLVMAHGITQFFLVAVQGNINASSLFQGPTPQNLKGNLNIMGLFSSLAPGGGSITNQDPGAYFGGDAISTLIGLCVGIYVLIFVTPTLLIATIMAVGRILVLYVLYVLGPVGIMLWAINWRELGQLGGKIIRNYVLLALFPIPAALVVAIMPIIAIGAEMAILSGLSDALNLNVANQGLQTGGNQIQTGNAALDILGLNKQIRGMIASAAVLLVGFAPWALVLGFSTATKLAGGAAAAGGAIATGGAALGAMGAMKGAKATGAGSKLAGAASKAGGAVTSRSSKASSLASAAKKGGGMAKSGMASRTPDTLKAAKSAAGENLKDRMKDAGVMEEDEDGNASYNKMRAAGIGMSKTGGALERSSMTGTMGTLAGKGMKGGSKGLAYEESAIGQVKEKKNLMREQDELQNTLAEDTDMSPEEAEAEAVALGDQFRPEEAKELLQRSDLDAKWKNLTGDRNRKLDTDGKEILGSLAMREMKDADGDYQQLEDDYGKPVADQMVEKSTEVGHSDIRSASRELGGDHEAMYLAGQMDTVEEHEESDLLGVMNERNGMRETLEAYERGDYDEDMAEQGRDEGMNRLENSDYIEVTGSSDDAISALAGGDDRRARDNLDASGLEDEILDAVNMAEAENEDGNIKMGDVRDKLDEDGELGALLDSMELTDVIETGKNGGVQEVKVDESDISGYLDDQVTGFTDFKRQSVTIEGPAETKIRELGAQIENVPYASSEDPIEMIGQVPRFSADNSKVQEIRKEAEQIADEKGIEEAQGHMQTQLNEMVKGYKQGVKKQLREADNIDTQAIVNNTSDIDSEDELAETIARDSVEGVQGAITDEISSNVEESIEKTQRAANEQASTAVAEKYRSALGQMDIVDQVPKAKSVDEVTAEKIRDVPVNEMDEINGDLQMANSLGKLVEENQKRRAEGLAETIQQANEEQMKEVKNVLDQGFMFDEINANYEQLVNEAQNGNTDAVAGLIEETGGVDDAQAEMVMNSMVDGNDWDEINSPSGELS